MQDGKDQDMDKFSKVNQALYDDAHVFENPTEVDRARAKKAFSVINEVINKKDLNSDNIFEDLLSEKSYQLDRVSSNSSLIYFFSSRKQRKELHRMIC